MMQGSVFLFSHALLVFEIDYIQASVAVETGSSGELRLAFPPRGIGDLLERSPAYSFFRLNLESPTAGEFSVGAELRVASALP